LNKKYSKDEYQKMVARIIEHMQKTGEWGEYFPVNLSPFDYNETIAQDHFPMSEEEVNGRGWRWRPKDQKEYQPATYNVPNSIREVQDDVLKAMCSCKQCGKNYRVIAQELKFYRAHNIPLPKLCPDCRHTERMKLRTPWRLWKRSCNKCNIEIETSYSPERPEIIYCEKCYLDEVY
jgi:hypothetical protein